MTTGLMLLRHCGGFWQPISSQWQPAQAATGFANLVTFTCRASDGLLLSPLTMVVSAAQVFERYLPLVLR